MNEAREYLRSYMNRSVKYPTHWRALRWCKELIAGDTLIFKVDDPEAVVFLRHHVRELHSDCPN